MALAAAQPARASCVAIDERDAIVTAEVSFVGTVIHLQNEDRWATVSVEEVWAGPDLPPIVEVRGGPGPGTTSSVDRRYQAGVRYIFVPSLHDGRLSDNNCSATTSWTAALAVFRPATVRAPVATGQRDATAPVPPSALLVPGLLIAGAAIAVFGAAALVRRRAR